MMRRKHLSELFNADLLKLDKVAIIGNDPMTTDQGGEIDQYPLVVRINNYQLGEQAGRKTDICFLSEHSPVSSNSSDNVKAVLAFKETGFNERRFDLFGNNVFALSADRLAELKTIIGIEQSNHILTGVVAAMEFIERGFKVHLYGFDFYRSGAVYYFENPAGVTEKQMTQWHQLEKEQVYLENHQQVVIHGLK